MTRSPIQKKKALAAKSTVGLILDRIERSWGDETGRADFAYDALVIKVGAARAFSITQFLRNP